MKKINTPYICLLVIVFGIISMQNIYYYDKHFSHVDDIGPIVSIQESISGKGYSYADCNQKMQTLSLNQFNLLNLSLDNNICNLYIKLQPYLAVPSSWTYGPFQFFFTAQLINQFKPVGYYQSKAIGRIPSLFFSLLGSLSVFWLFKYHLPIIKDSIYLPLIASCLSAISLEQRIMSAQAESYAIGLLSSVIIYYSFIRFLKYSSDRKFANILLPAILITIAICMTYQSLLLALCGYIGVFYMLLCNKAGHKVEVLKKMSIFTFFLVALGFISYVPFLIKILIQRGQSASIGWNAGVSNEFLVVNKSSLDERLLDYSKLVVHELLPNIYSFLSGIEFDSIIYQSITGFIFLVIMIYGLILIYKNVKNDVCRLFIYIFILYTLLYNLLIFTSFMTFSPTRHLLILLLPSLVLIIYGLQLLISKTKCINATILIILFYFFSSIYFFENFSKNRTDPLSDSIIDTIIDNNFVVISDKSDWDFRLAKNYNGKYLYTYDALTCEFISTALFNRDKHYIWFSKRRDIDDASSEVLSNLTKSIGLCGITNADIFNVELIENTVHKSSNIEIDLSNKTKNGSNSLFLQVIKFNFL